jgi:sugar lactone lactonase YvrE
MGDSSRALVTLAALVCAAGCGDPLVVVGDAPGIVRIIAGIPEVAGDSIGGRATETQLSSPRGVATGADGELYVADHMNSRILVVQSSGAVQVLLDHSQRQEEPRIQRPDGLALDGAGGLVLADPRGHRVWRLDLVDGTVLPLAGTGVQGSAPDTVDAVAADLATPVGVAVDAERRVYFSEMAGHRVRRIESDGTLITFAGTGTAEFGGDGGPAAAASLKQPAGLAVKDGLLYIADSGNHRIRIVNLETSVIETVAGAGGAGFRGDGGPAGEALLDNPYSVAVSANGGNLFIADTENHRVRVVNLESLVIATFAGTGDGQFRGDLLPAASTSLSEPRGLVVSSLSFLFISDTGHHIVRRTAVGFLSTVSSRLSRKESP